MTSTTDRPQRAARAPHIAVVGPADADPRTYDAAVELGRLLGERGAVVVCGGLGGVMEAAALGASRAGGSSLGILPGADRAQANPYLTATLATGLGELRNGLVVRAGDAMVAVGGSWGTLSEVALALRLGMAVVSLGGWSVLDSAGVAVPGPIRADSPAQAVELLFAALARR